MTQYVAYLRTVEKIAVQLVESRRQANIGQSGFEQSEQYRVFAAVDYLYSFAELQCGYESVRKNRVSQINDRSQQREVGDTAYQSFTECIVSYLTQIGRKYEIRISKSAT